LKVLGFRLQTVEKLNIIFSNIPVETFFFCETRKSATNFDKIIYNLQFHRQPRKPVGGFL